MSDSTELNNEKMKYIKTIVLITIVFQNCGYALSTRYSRSVLKEKWSEYEVVMVAEFVKLIISICLMKIDTNTNTNTSVNSISNNKNFFNRIIFLLWSGKSMIFIVVGYVISNICVFVSLQRIDASVYTVLSQLKLLVTAALSVCFLKTYLSYTKVRALVLLGIGSILVTSANFQAKPTITTTTSDVNSANQHNASDVLIGVSCCLLMVLINSSASIYLEKLLKDNEIKFTIWERNIQLAFYSLCVISIICTYDYIDFSSFNVNPNSNSNPDINNMNMKPKKVPFQGWSFLTCGIVLFQAVGGILVATTLKYADSIVKNFAVAGSIMLSTVLGYFFFNGHMDIFVILGCLSTILALFNYTFDTTVTNNTMNNNNTSSSTINNSSNTNLATNTNTNSTNYTPLSIFNTSATTKQKSKEEITQLL